MTPNYPHSFELDRSIPYYDLLQMHQWCEQNCKDQYQLLYQYGIIKFEHADEAVLFALKWL
jgi:hypothetical protein